MVAVGSVNNLSSPQKTKSNFKRKASGFIAGVAVSSIASSLISIPSTLLVQKKMIKLNRSLSADDKKAINLMGKERKYNGMAYIGDILRRFVIVHHPEYLNRLCTDGWSGHFFAVWKK